MATSKPPETPAFPLGFAEAPGIFQPATGTTAPGPAALAFTRRHPAGTSVPGGSSPNGSRDRLLERGPDALADHELLEMLLGFAVEPGAARPLARALIHRFGSFAGVLASPQQGLLETQGLSPHGVAALKLVQAAALRLARAEVIDQPVLNNWDRLMDYLTAVLAREKVEQFRVLFLDSKNRLIADEAQARGTVNHTPVYPREVVRRCLELHATALILVHNHPSGDPTPSRADIGMTAEIKAAAAVLGVVLHDHIVLGNGRFTSFRREALL
ncbi:DNA repair protein RadC [Siccirubricoccus deserti]|uniref:RadC family protein n=1 Tax=Siccirubricoccus deserti TaxID=2013562 RepID=UPI0019A7E481|nr:DNA repair protein RadC [Siccirubricoccus deserti]GGC70098.1 DNA repair protein RadC [Siccirubricoccus deserti]